MLDALAAGGTSFDSLYVNVNGASGYFDRTLMRTAGKGSPATGAPPSGITTSTIRREQFMNRSSYTCPVCQPRPRNGRW